MITYFHEDWTHKQIETIQNICLQLEAINISMKQIEGRMSVINTSLAR